MLVETASDLDVVAAEEAMMEIVGIVVQGLQSEVNEALMGIGVGVV